jgi:hypothetical protein
LQREIHAIRQRHDYTGEFKFSKITDRNIRRFFDLIEVLADSDVRLVATIVDGARYNPFKGRPQWEAHAGVISQLIIGTMNKNEIATVIVDGISTPPGCSVGTNIKRGVNSRLRATAVAQAFCLDSRTNDLLQAADLVSGAIFNQRSGQGRSDSPKGKVARRLANAFDIADFSDQRKGRVTFATLDAPRPRSRTVSVLRTSSTTA